MEGFELVAVALWALAITLGGAVVVEGGGVSVGGDRELSIDVETTLADVGLYNLSDDGSPTGVVEAEGIDADTDRHASTGFCAIGFDSEQAPVGFDVDGERGQVHAQFDATNETSGETTPDRSTADEILDRCHAERALD